MTRSATTRHVVERCPSCGVEHDHPARECEACGTPVRYWCRAHGHEAGWLDGPACARCAEEAARPAPRPRPSVSLPCPAPAMPAPVHVAAAPPADAAKVAEVAASPAEVSADDARAARRGPDGGVMFMILFFTVAGGAFGGMVLSTPFVMGSTVHLDTLLRFLVAGGISGLLFGAYACRVYVQDLRARARSAAPPRV